MMIIIKNKLKCFRMESIHNWILKKSTVYIAIVKDPKL